MIIMNTFDYYKFQTQYVIPKINEEINFYQQSGFDKTLPISEYIFYLKTRLGIDKLEKNMNNEYYKKYDIKKLDIDEYGKNMDVISFKKPWSRLREYHKIMKIKEFVDKLEYDKKSKKKNIDQNKEFIKQELINGIKNKKFNKKKNEIEYNISEMKIDSISCLDYDSNKGLYEINWDN